MSDTTDMSTPVTRGELREELANQLSALTSLFATKGELDLWGGALTECMIAMERALQASKAQLLAHVEASETRLLSELARHTKASQEATTTLIAATDDKYADLPGRVSSLEQAASGPARR